MEYAIAVAAGFIAGVVFCWLFKAKAQADLRKELDKLKAGATNAIGKL